MNPSANIFNGRFELPDNIKSFFREIKLVAAGVQRVSEVLLDLYGFDKPKDNGKKMAMLFNTLSTNLNRKN